MWVTGTGGVLGVPRVLLDLLIVCLWGWFVVRSKVKRMILCFFFLYPSSFGVGGVVQKMIYADISVGFINVIRFVTYIIYALMSVVLVT